MKASVIAFIGVGALAALVHYAVAVLSHAAGLAPMWSNGLGFMFAFPVSYLGHRQWTFRHSQASHPRALIKFLLVALFGFFANQGLVFIGLRWTPLQFWLVLAVAMVVVAVTTYGLSRYWAFKHG